MMKIIRGIIRALKKRFAGAQIKVRLLAIAAFAVFAFLGGNEAVDIAKSISNPETTATTLGVTTQESTIRAVIVFLLGAVICVASLATIVGAMQRTTLLRGWIVVTVAYLLYALYHLSFAIIQMHGSQLQAFIPGAVYLCLAAAAYSFGRQASRALDPVVH
jgi:hypothetical protein